MNTMTDIAIIGAGPYGLSLATHVAAAGLGVRVFGPPMNTWRTSMPEGMVLKSEGFASNLWHPDGAFTLRQYCAEHDLPYQDSGLPVPLRTFADYGIAFQQRFVPDLDERWVTGLDRAGDAFVLRLDDDEIVVARRVVIAAGIGSFHYTPQELDPIKGPLCSHSIEHHALDRFAGKEVLVVGGGASGVELAALMTRKGAAVTVAARRRAIRYCGAPAPRGLLDKIRSPETGLGTGWRSVACVAAPMVFHGLPRGFRHMVVRRHLGPAPGWACRAEVESNVNVILRAKISSARVRGDTASVQFRLDGGSERTVEAEHVIAATGFRVDARRLRFIAPRLLRNLNCADHAPVLSRNFETSIPGLFMVGITAANNFGPLLRFAYGAGFASRRLSRYLLKTAVRPTALSRPLPVPG